MKKLHERGRDAERGRPRPQQPRILPGVRNSAAPLCWRNRCGRGRPRSCDRDLDLAGAGEAKEFAIKLEDDPRHRDSYGVPGSARASAVVAQPAAVIEMN